MTEAVQRFTDFAFERFGLARIYVSNRASCRLLEKAGFELEGRMHSSSVIKEGRLDDQFLCAKISVPW